MSIRILETKEIKIEDIIILYKANEWSSAEKPDLLYKGLLNSETLITAWDDTKLVGLGNAISDGYLTVYYPHLLILPEYQGKGITSKMVSETLDFCFNTLNMNKVFICTSKINKASQQIALKHHFKQEGILREEFKSSEGTLEDIVYFGLLKSE